MLLTLSLGASVFLTGQLVLAEPKNGPGALFGSVPAGHHHTAVLTIATASLANSPATSLPAGLRFRSALLPDGSPALEIDVSGGWDVIIGNGPGDWTRKVDGPETYQYKRLLNASVLSKKNYTVVSDLTVATTDLKPAVAQARLVLGFKGEIGAAAPTKTFENTYWSCSSLSPVTDCDYAAALLTDRIQVSTRDVIKQITLRKHGASSPDGEGVIHLAGDPEIWFGGRMHANTYPPAGDGSTVAHVLDLFQLIKRDFFFIPRTIRRVNKNGGDRELGPVFCPPLVAEY